MDGFLNTTKLFNADATFKKLSNSTTLLHRFSINVGRKSILSIPNVLVSYKLNKSVLFIY